jgi:hypothetical protein
LLLCLKVYIGGIEYRILYNSIYPSDTMPNTEEKLKKEGWVRQFTTDEPRLSESVELYKSLGYEVHLEPATPEEIHGECGVCFEGKTDAYKTIYTRRKTE